MKKRPLCAICIIFLVAQCVRVLFFGVDDMRSSALEKAFAGEGFVRLTGTVYRIEEKKKVTAFYLKDNVVTASGRNFSETDILVYYSNEREKKEIKIGNILEISGEAGAFDSARNPGNFDQKAYYQRAGSCTCPGNVRGDIAIAGGEQRIIGTGWFL